MFAATIAGVVFTLALGVVNHLSLQQSKVERAQRFYSEGRILMDRISVFARNQTIDYDRYWKDFVGDTEGVGCLNFLQGHENFFGIPDEKLLYPDGFYIDAQDLGESGGVGILDTFRGGVDGSGNESSCTQAIHDLDGDGLLTQLYLINNTRTQRTTITFDSVGGLVELQRELGADTDNDGVVDLWSSEPAIDINDGLCKIDDGFGNLKIIKGDFASESFCRTAHDSISITPDFIQVLDLRFMVSPDRDPYLAYELPDKRIQPHAIIKMDLQFRDAQEQGYSLNQVPRINLQTSSTSRVYGNTRPAHDIYRFCSTPRCE